MNAETVRPSRRAPLAGITPLHEAATYGHQGAVSLLLASAADVHARILSPLGFKTFLQPLHTAACSANGDEVARLLVEDRADVDARIGFIRVSPTTWTPLIFAAAFNNAKVIEALLALGADPDLRCSGLFFRLVGIEGTALDLARNFGRAAAEAALDRQRPPGGREPAV